MVSLTELLAFAGEWGPSGVVGLVFGWMVAAIVRDRRFSTGSVSGPTPQDLVDKIMKATDAAADTKALRDDVDEIKTGVAKIHEAQIRLLTILETRQ